MLARTPDAPEGAKGLSLFVVPKFLVNADGSLGERNAVTTVAIEHKLGIHGSPTCVLAYEGATGYLVGEIGQGLAGMFVMMNQERVGVGVQGTALTERALQQAAGYAAERLQGPVIDRPAGTPIAEHPDVRRLLLSMSSQAYASRSLGVLVNDLFDRGEADATALAEFLVPVLKGWSTEQAILATSDGVQVHGGMGFIEETGAAQHYRDVKITTIYEGTTAIQSNDLLGRKLLRNQGAVAEAFFAQVAETSSALAGSDNPVATRTAERLDRAVASARTATTSLLGFASSLRDASAVSVPYLMLLGTLAGAWQHALAVAAVLKHDALTDADTARLTAADFYGAHHLPQVHALAETVASGETA
ncbi:MAG: acyl-CoA dehydrogenase [Microbacterium sp.]